MRSRSGLFLALLVLAAVAAARPVCAGGRSDGFGAAPGRNGAQAPARPRAEKAVWRFAVSGDSRDCGDVVMPAIARQVLASGAEFYWHLGDFRRIYDFDEDMQHEPAHRARPMTIIGYEQQAWQDFIENQLAPFGSLPLFLGIGNHEVIPPKTRQDYLLAFADWLDSPVLRAQRLRDDPNDHQMRGYFHWMMKGVDFINLDNVTPDQFDAPQLSWFERVLARDEASPEVKAVVVGMHKPLPGSLVGRYSMEDSPTGMETGRRVYLDLLRAQDQAQKRVYVLQGHKHVYMAGVFHTDYWRTHGGMLPGWVIGTAGATRYALPADAGLASTALTNVYGYLLADVHPDGRIDFVFHRITESDIPAAVRARYTPEFVHWCEVENTQAR
jgi:hypothetical protein